MSDNIISLGERVTALEETIRNSRRTSMSLVPLMRVIMEEIKGDGEFGTATSEILDLIRFARTQQDDSPFTILCRFIDNNDEFGL